MKLITSAKLRAFKPVFLVLFLVGAGLVAYADPIITNGSFEDGYHQPETSPSSTDRLSLNPGTVTGWVVGGNRLVASTAIEGASDGTYAAGFDGYADRRGTTLSQSFFTTVGLTYVVSFDAAVFGTPTGNQSLLSQVSSASSIVLNSIDPVLVAEDGTDTSTVPFVTYTYEFMATSSTSTILFEDMSAQGTNGGADTILDNVVVAVATPEPSTWAMAFAGLGALLLVRIRRKSNSQA